MVTPGERFAQRLTVEAPDFCTNSCLRLTSWLIQVAGEVDAGMIIAEEALAPYTSVVHACQRAVEAGGLSKVTAGRASQDLNAMYLPRPNQTEAPCVLNTHIFWHAEMYARGDDPYDGFLDDDE